MTPLARQLLAASTCAVALATTVAADTIKHVFVATDESGKQLHYVDQFDPSNDWTIPLPGNRDIQLSGNGTVLVNIADGYREYDFKGGKLIKEVKVGIPTRTLVRTNDGHTFLGGANGVVELDKDDKRVAFHERKMGRFFRLLRLASNGNFLYTSGETSVSETTPAGEVIRKIDLAALTPETKKPYFMEEMGNGRFLISTGYGATILVVDKDGTLMKSYGGKGKIDGVEAHFFADVQQLDNGHFVVAHWSGHRREDSRKAPQAIEFNQDGKVVWTWHDPERAGTLHGIEIIR